MRTNWQQRIALASSLCLTVLTIACTITRLVGIVTIDKEEKFDPVRSIFWLYMAADVALTMTAATAFRAIFVSRVQGKLPKSSTHKSVWHLVGGGLLRSAFVPRPWRSKSKSDTSEPGGNSHPLPNHFPHGTMIGIGTFINGRGKSFIDESQIVCSISRADEESPWPLTPETGGKSEITIKFDIEASSYHVRPSV